jgi:hypothetical protein
MTHKQMSAKGGRAGRGAAKARTREQARAAAMVRWSKGKRAVAGSLVKIVWEKRQGPGYRVGSAELGHGVGKGDVE